jgi:hypothetical protein
MSSYCAFQGNSPLLNPPEIARESPMKGGQSTAEEYLRTRLDGCRKGGQRSGITRRKSAKRSSVECAIAYRRERGDYTRDAASQIARYLGVSPRYVRLLAAIDEEKRK